MSRTGQITITSVANIAKYFFKNSTGSYVASGIQGTELNPNDTSTYGFNSLLAPAAFKIQYNNIPFIELTSVTNSTTNTQDNTLRFYSSSTTTRGPRAMELTNNELAFYNIDSSNDKVASLSTNGLILASGGIIARTAGQNGYVYLSSEDNTNSITINDHTPTQNDPKWRQVIGTKFGVDSEGNLYANNANLKSADVTGAITATSLTIVSDQNAYNGIDAINISGYSITIEIDTTHAGLTINQVYLKPHLLHNGEDITSTVTDKTQFIWYVNGGSIGTQGASADGGVVAAYDDVWKVTYEFAEGAVDGASVVQTIEVDPSKYITRINQYGITVHPETVAQGSHYTQIDGNGLYIKELVGSAINLSNDSTLASFTATGIRMGLENASHFNITPTKLSGNLNTNEYFSIEDKYGVPTTYTYYSDGETRDFRIYYPSAEPIVTIDDTPTTDFVYTDSWVVFDSVPTAGSIISITYSSSRSAPAFTNGIRSGQTGLFSFVIGSDNTASGLYSIAEGRENQATNSSSHAEGRLTIASGEEAHSEGWRTTASGSSAHAEGSRTIASGPDSHAEGSNTTASGVNSHAEGDSTIASGVESHAEGDSTIASGTYSHAEGEYTIASGVRSHAQNEGTIADGHEQTAIGRYNARNISDNAFVIGNGEDDDNRSNALTVNWDGGLSHGIQNITSDITLTDVTSGATITHQAYKSGQVVTLILSVTSTASWANGGNINFTLSGKFLPYHYVTGGGYYGARAVNGSVKSDTQLGTLRNTGTAISAIPSTSPFIIQFAYITEDMN